MYLLKPIYFALFFLFSMPLTAQVSQIGSSIRPVDSDESFGFMNNIDISNNGKKIVIGSTYGASHTPYTGKYTIYEWNDTGWIMQGNPILGLNQYDHFGQKAAMSNDGNRILTSAILHSGSWYQSGLVQVYEWQDTAWEQLGNDVEGTYYSARAGMRLAMSGDGNCIAFTHRTGSFNVPSQGAVEVLQWDGNNWQPKGNTFSGIDSFEYKGLGLALSADGNTIAIGTPELGSPVYGHVDTGFVQVYDWNGNTWIQRGDILKGDSIGSNFGSQVRLSEDGLVLSVGDPEPGPHLQKGFVKVYEWNGAAWQQRGNTLTGPNEMIHDLNADGSVLLTTDFLDDSAGQTNRGIVRVYDWNGVQWQARSEAILGETAYDQFGRSAKIDSSGWIVLGVSPNQIVSSNTGRSARVLRYCQPNSIGTQVQQQGNQLNASFPNATYQWLSCDDSLSVINGANNSTYTALSSGFFAVEIAQFGCVDTSSCIQVLMANVPSISDENLLATVFPNPGHEFVTVQFKEAESYSLQVQDVSGRILEKKENVTGADYQLNIRNYPVGVYFVLINKGIRNQVLKIIKK